jgi:phage gp46-like protein
MSVYSPTGSSNQRIDQVLTNISIGWSNEGMIGERLFPVVVVRKQSDKYYTFGREAWLPEAGDYRGPGTEANEIPGLQVSLDTYYAQEHSLQIAVTDEERENTDAPFAPDRDGAELVTSKILLGREKAMHDMVTDATKYATSMTTTLSGTAQWSDYTNSNPIADIKAARYAMHALTFIEPNTIVIPYQVMAVLEDHPDFMARIQYTDRAILTPELIGAVIGFSNIIVPGMGVASDASLVPGYLWGKDVIIAWVPPRAGLRTPSFAYEFVWGYGGNTPMVTDRWREEKRKSDIIRTSRRYDLKLVGTENNSASPNNGKVVTGYLIKNAVA